MNGIPFVMNFNLIVASQKGAGCLAVRGWVWFSSGGGPQHSWKRWKPGSRLFWGEILKITKKKLQRTQKSAWHCVGECVFNSGGHQHQSLKVLTNLMLTVKCFLFDSLLTDQNYMANLFWSMARIANLQDVDLEIWNESMQKYWQTRKHIFEENISFPLCLR